MLIALEEKRDLFRDNDAFENFIQFFRDAVANDATPLVVSGHEPLFTAVSPESAQQLLAGRILKRLAENPEMLSNLKDRLESEDIVE